MQVTLVSHYGRKEQALVELISHLQAHLERCLSEAFRPYPLDQVHGTIAGLEGCRSGDVVRNQYSNQEVDLRGLTNFLNGETMEPIEVRIGGYRRDDPSRFDSRGLHPYLRSFSIQGEIAVAMGWPVQSDHFRKPLDSMRRQVQRFGLRHKWHKTGTDVDDDFFFVLGRVDRRRVGVVDLDSVAEEIRLILASHTGTRLHIQQNTLRFVGYLDPQLPIETSCSYSIDEPDLPKKLTELFPDCRMGNR